MRTRLALCTSTLTLALAGSASASTLVLSGNVLEWQGTSGADTVTVDPTTIGFSFSDPSGITVAPSADPICGPGGTVVSCTTSALPVGKVAAIGGAGEDTITMELSWGAEKKLPFHVEAGPGDDVVTGGSGDDTIYLGSGDDIASGRAGNDSLWGENHHDVLDGGEGDDLLSGDAGDDMLTGGEGDDTLRGEDGADELRGGAGSDELTGGAGTDLFFGDAGADTIAAKDGVAETVDCGADADTAETDPVDVRTVRAARAGRAPRAGPAARGGARGPGAVRRRSGADGHGAVRRSAAAGPGAAPIALRAAAPLADGRIAITWIRGRGRTKIHRATVTGARRGGRIVIRCKAPSRKTCRRAKVVVPVTGPRTAITKRFPARTLPAGVEVTVSIEQPGATPRVARWRTRKGRLPVLVS
jgi:hypothetical protein